MLARMFDSEFSATDDATVVAAPLAALIVGESVVPTPLLSQLIRGGAKVRPIVMPSDEPEPHYRPSAELAEFVRMRDLYCRAPAATCRPTVATSTTPSFPIRSGRPTRQTSSVCVELTSDARHSANSLIGLVVFTCAECRPVRGGWSATIQYRAQSHAMENPYGNRLRWVRDVVHDVEKVVFRILVCCLELSMFERHCLSTSGLAERLDLDFSGRTRNVVRDSAEVNVFRDASCRAFELHDVLDGDALDLMIDHVDHSPAGDSAGVVACTWMVLWWYLSGDGNLYPRSAADLAVKGRVPSSLCVSFSACERPPVRPRTSLTSRRTEPSRRMSQKRPPLDAITATFLGPFQSLCSAAHSRNASKSSESANAGQGATKP
jgi:hypothetical protein